MERYTGFYIDKPYGNNVFSYEERENKRIFVPKLIEGVVFFKPYLWYEVLNSIPLPSAITILRISVIIGLTFSKG